jgi:two-component system, OmpR family, sensor histidine kinase VicK
VARNDSSNELSYSLTNLNEFLQEVAHGWRHMSDFKSHLQLNLPKQPVYAQLNAEKFQRVIDNLISNAAKFSKEGDTITINLRSTAQQVKVEVQDQGVGIPAALLPQVFDRFSKAGRKGLKGEQSTGLGLSISKQIVEKHQGHIKVQSQEGKGTTFVITLPAVA